MAYNLLIDGVYWGYNTHLLTMYQLPGTSNYLFFLNHPDSVTQGFGGIEDSFDSLSGPCLHIFAKMTKCPNTLISMIFAHNTLGRFNPELSQMKEIPGKNLLVNCLFQGAHVGDGWDLPSCNESLPWVPPPSLLHHLHVPYHWAFQMNVIILQ